MRPFILIVLFAVLYSYPTEAQTAAADTLEKTVTRFNDALQYDRSIKTINAFTADSNKTPYERYCASLLKAYTYKRVFNYEETLANLDVALAEGLKSGRAAEVRNCIKAEKAFVYFDLNEYDKAALLMRELEKSGYALLPQEEKSFIIMQEGYLLMLKKNYPGAERKLDAAIAIAKQYVPRNLPNIYGKKIELYNAMGKYDKRDAAFNEGLRIAKSYKIIKYELYLYEILRNQYRDNNDYRKAFEMQQHCDSLTAVYNAAEKNTKIQILEKRIALSQEQAARQAEKSVRMFLICLVSVLLLLVIVLGRLFVITKQKRLLAEKENTRIHQDIERLSREMDELGNNKLDLSRYPLTVRQLDIIRLIREGKSNKEIAASLFISENTVKYHLKIIYEALDIENRVQLIR